MGQEESITGPFIQLFDGNPFAKKIVTKVKWQYDKVAGDFINSTPKYIVPDAISSVTLNDNVYFNIIEKNGVFFIYNYEEGF